MKDYKTYLFDIDGTLLDTMELIYQTFHYSCNKYAGLDLDRETVWSAVGIPLDTQLEMYLGDLGDDLKKVFNIHEDYQRSIYQEFLKIFPGVRETLGALFAKGKGLGVVTSRTMPSLMRYLSHFDIDQYFSVFITPECSDKHKPEPDPVLLALEKFGTRPEETLFLGDAEVDILSGSRAGVDTAFAKWGPNRLEDLKIPPTWDLDSIKELLS
ncbi:MAG: hypothetical protein B6241_08745 [Spirochaetaceae bacterium 4572_59]|nr:MAG: hypothetical protein B6241_08745 [Spirochaetaceae bacterium 4572_59]